jgi:peptidyl-tRNA hydrolase, PTH2 family
MDSHPLAVKQVIVIRRDLKMRRGKEIAQGAHASMAWLSERARLNASVTGPEGAIATVLLSPAEWAWISGPARKITCQVHSEEELQAVHDAAWEAGVRAELITDSGLTEFHGVPTVTALAVGPQYDDVIDKITGHLELY